MHLVTRNVNSGFRDVLRTLSAEPPEVVRRNSRNGPVLRFTRPLTVTFTNPTERVLFNTARDANPYSLLYEGLWTLAGRRDVAPLCYYTKKMTDYSDDGETWHGAYGHRWRTHFDGDQLRAAADALRIDGTTRRVVIAMWDPEVDLFFPPGNARDLPCNTHAYLEADEGRLNLTVCNRSNDAIWGALGANYVVLSMLLEYMAACTGLEVGEYHQFSKNYHCYVETNSGFRPAEWLASGNGGRLEPSYELGAAPDPAPSAGGRPVWTAVPLVKDPAAFERELPLIVQQYSGAEPMEDPFQKYTEPFLRDVARPMFDAWLSHKKGTNTAPDHAARIAADDWRIACTAWLRRRADRKAGETTGGGSI